MELNKIFAAVLVACITAMLAGFAAEVMTEGHELEKDAVTIEGGAEAGSGGGSAVAAPEPILSLIATADVAQGEKLSKACASCHSFDKGGAVKQGPNLWGVVGRNKASNDFPPGYSEGMKALGGAWDYSALNHFLWKPKKFVPGTKMTFLGLKKPEDRAAIIAWLRTLADSPHGLPSKGEIDAEAAELAPTPPAAAAPPAEAPKEGEHSPVEAAPAEKH